MWIPLLASATLVIGVAASAALGLLIVLYVRQSRGLATLSEGLDRVAKAQIDSAADVRSRLETGASELEAVRGHVQTAVEAVPAAVGQMEAEVATLREGVAAQTPLLEAVDTRLGQMEAQVAGLEARVIEVAAHGTEGVALVREEWTQIESMIERSERQLAAFEAGRNQEERRLEDLRSAVGSLRGTVEDKIDAQEDRLQALEEGPRSQIENAAAGLDPLTGATDAVPYGPPERAAEGALDSDEPQEIGTRWIFVMLAALLGLALLAQFLA